MDDLTLTPDDLIRLRPLSRPEQAIALLTGRIGPLAPTGSSTVSSEALGPEVARLAYVLHLSRAYGFATGILKGKKPSDAMETWRARVRSSITRTGPLAFTLDLFRRLGCDWDAARLEDRRWLRVWDDEMRTGEVTTDRSRSPYWPVLQVDTVVSEANTGADLLRDWLRALGEPDDARKASIDDETLAMLTPAQRLELGLPL